MRQDFYDYSRDRDGRYRFTKRGKRNIIKVVDFTPTNHNGIYNLWFGDLLPDNSIDDMVISNNGDIVKVLATVIQITREIMAEMPFVTIVFKGSTTGRMALYKRILQKKLYRTREGVYYFRFCFTKRELQRDNF